MKILMRNGRDRRSENPFWATARKERVVLVGTDQRITSGPAAKRLHSKAGYMAAPERVADSQIPLAPRAPSIHGPWPPRVKPAECPQPAKASSGLYAEAATAEARKAGRCHLGLFRLVVKSTAAVALGSLRGGGFAAHECYRTGTCPSCRARPSQFLIWSHFVTGFWGEAQPSRTPLVTPARNGASPSKGE